jgi:hypothetical protein
VNDHNRTTPGLKFTFKGSLIGHRCSHQYAADLDRCTAKVPSMPNSHGASGAWTRLHTSATRADRNFDRMRKTTHSRRQLPIQFLNHLGQFRAKELVHLAQAALGVEGGVFKVVYFNAEVGGDVVADHF